MKHIVAGVVLAAACAEDPIVKAWHHPFQVTTMSQGTGSCDPALTPTDPDTPFLFFAVGLGVPNVLTLYWCAGVKDCPVSPWVTISPVDLTTSHAEGALAQDVTLSDTTCQVYWDGIVADLNGTTMTATVSRWFPEDIFVVDNPSDCETLVANAVNVECDEVTTLEGVVAD